ncbi:MULTISPECIES: GNAT family N-acetyltransferase [unclassified Shimia]|uniref:GNAT family N-acetyltransferase n=1 Tax=unclassified Shimia TaxID=2630038 RepID=UPI0031088B77
MIEIRRFTDENIADRNALFDLIDRVQRGVPYNDTDGSMSAADWAPKALDDSSLILLAMEGSEVLGYCFGQPYQSYEGFLSSASEYGVQPNSCLYLSEFGVDERVRKRGVGTKLINALLAETKGNHESILVRTMLHVFGTHSENPAIQFYKKAGFDLVLSGEEILIEKAGRFAERPRIFLRWRDI